MELHPHAALEMSVLFIGKPLSQEKSYRLSRVLVIASIDSTEANQSGQQCIRA